MEYPKDYDKIYCLCDDLETELLLYNETGRHAIRLKVFDVIYYQNFDVGFPDFPGTEIYDRAFILAGIRESDRYYIRIDIISSCRTVISLEFPVCRMAIRIS